MDAELKEQVEAINWYHTFEIFPGIWTNGSRGYKVDPKARLNNVGVPKDLTGKVVLDVGTFDGMYAFELERRGADVYAIDIQDPNATAFNQAKRLLKSNVKFTRTTVYEVSKVGLPEFDYVLYFGVFYHLKHPVLAFRRLRRILKDDGAIFFDGVVLDTLWNRIDELSLSQKEIEKIRHLPIAYYSDPRRESWNWHFPTVACLSKWVETAGFKEPVIKFYDKRSSVVGSASCSLNVPMEHNISNANTEAEETDALREEYY